MHTKLIKIAVVAARWHFNCVCIHFHYLCVVFFSGSHHAFRYTQSSFVPNGTRQILFVSAQIFHVFLFSCYYFSFSFRMLQIISKLVVIYSPECHTNCEFKKSSKRLSLWLRLYSKRIPGMMIIVCTIFMWTVNTSVRSVLMENGNERCAQPYLYLGFCALLRSVSIWLAVYCLHFSDFLCYIFRWANEMLNLKGLICCVMYTSSNHCESGGCGLVEEHQYRSCVAVYVHCKLRRRCNFCQSTHIFFSLLRGLLLFSVQGGRCYEIQELLWQAN